MATCKIITNDGAEVILLESVAHRFITLSHVIQNIESNDPIPLPSISWNTLNTLLTYLNYFIEKNDEMLDFPKFCEIECMQTIEEQNLYYKWVINKKFLDDWETKFYNGFNDEALYDLWLAADYLNCPFLMDSFKIEGEWRKIRGLGQPFNPTV